MMREAAPPPPRESATPPPSRGAVSPPPPPPPPPVRGLAPQKKQLTPEDFEEMRSRIQPPSNFKHISQLGGLFGEAEEYGYEVENYNFIAKFLRDHIPQFDANVNLYASYLDILKQAMGYEIIAPFLNAKNKRDYGRTRLHVAAITAANEPGKIIDLLVEHGADVNAIDHNGHTPLDLAVKVGNTEAADHLRAHHAKHGVNGAQDNITVSLKIPRTPPSHSTARRHPPPSRGAAPPPPPPPRESATPPPSQRPAPPPPPPVRGPAPPPPSRSLQKAPEEAAASPTAPHEDIEVLRKKVWSFQIGFTDEDLQEIKASGRGKLGRTLLHAAIYYTSIYSIEKIEIADFIACTDSIREINVQDHHGQTPLHHTVAKAYGHHTNTINLLIAHGADTSITDKNGHTPLDIAFIISSHDAVNCLLAHHAKHKFQYAYDKQARYGKGPPPPPIRRTTYDLLEAMVSSRIQSAKALQTIDAQMRLLDEKYQKLLALQSKQASSTVEIPMADNAEIKALRQQIQAQESQLADVAMKLSEHDQALAAAKQMQVKFSYYEQFLSEMMSKKKQKANIASSAMHAAYVSTYQEVMHATYFAALVTRSELVALENKGAMANAGTIVGVIGDVASNLVPAFGTVVSVGAQIGKAVLLHCAEKNQRAQLAHMSELKPNPVDWCQAVEEVATQIAERKWEEITRLEKATQAGGIKVKVTGWLRNVTEWLSAQPSQSLIQRYAAEDAMAGLELITGGKVLNAAKLVDALVTCAMKAGVSSASSPSTPTATYSPAFKAATNVASAAHKVAEEAKQDAEFARKHAAISVNTRSDLAEENARLKRKQEEMEREQAAHKEEMAQMRRMIEQLVLARQQDGAEIAVASSSTTSFAQLEAQRSKQIRERPPHS